jgi:mannose-6-phosphate isomerase
VDLITGYLQNYEWGSLNALADLRGVNPSGSPEAEIWFGVHPSGPSTVERELGRITLQEAINLEEEEMPYLVKILAAQRPLSLQAHPDQIQAASGFADNRSKPEMICALTPFQALCGFKTTSEAYEVSTQLQLPEDLLFMIKEAVDLSQVIESILTKERKRDIESLTQMCKELIEGGSLSSEAETIIKVAKEYPEDPSLLIIPMMQIHTLKPGEALFLNPGVLHAYLEGVALEVMGSSDNVVRAGFTTKEKDPATLLKILDFEASPQIQTPSSGHHRYQTMTPEFDLERIERTTIQVSGREGTDIVVSTLMDTVLTSEKEELILKQGSAAWIPKTEGAYHIQTEGIAYRVIG